jgi:prepilin-type N-terminal cleavage/methylation domain-containing protein
VIARRHQQAGFTLVEVMVGVMVGTAVSLVLASAFLLGYRTISREARQIAGDQAVSGASLSMVRDLTSATTISTGTITAGGGTFFTITYGSAPVITIRYQIDARNNLIRTVVGGGSSVAARGMQSITIGAPPNPPCYYTLTIRPSAVGAAAVSLNVSRRTGPQGCF